MVLAVPFTAEKSRRGLCRTRGGRAGPRAPPRSQADPLGPNPLTSSCQSQLVSSAQRRSAGPRGSVVSAGPGARRSVTRHVPGCGSVPAGPRRRPPADDAPVQGSLSVTLPSSLQTSKGLGLGVV